MKYSFHPEAEQDLREAATFYRDNAGNTIAQALFNEFEHYIGLILRHPGMGSLWRHHIRRCYMKRFPFSIIYTVLEDQIYVLAVAHNSRRPNYWRGRKK
jgi:toxin ParE1/3/4